MTPKRRHHGVKRAIKVLKRWQDCHKTDLLEAFNNNENHWAKKMLKTRTLCSCMMCRNPRRVSKKYLTIQEEKQLISFKEQLDETA